MLSDPRKWMVGAWLVAAATLLWFATALLITGGATVLIARRRPA